jgi:solute carrier family 50 protein (sugar transporter)
MISGVLTCLGIYLSDYSKVAQIVKSGDLGSYNVLPNMMCFVNTFSWVMYGLMVGNYYIFCPNVVGMNFTLFYALSVYHLAPADKRNLIRNVLLVGQSFVLLGSLAAFVTLVPYDTDGTLREQVSGWVAVIALLVFYSSPLTDLANVIKSRDASSISLPLAVANGINGSLWTAYGFAIGNAFVWAPNLAGIATVLVQLFLLFIYRNNIKSMNDASIYMDNDVNAKTSLL